MDAPNHHRYEANLTVGDPTVRVLVVTRRDDRGLAEIAAGAHFTFKMTVDSFFTVVPAAGASDTTLVHVGWVPAPGPRVE